VAFRGIQYVQQLLSSNFELKDVIKLSFKISVDSSRFKGGRAFHRHGKQLKNDVRKYI